VRQADRRGSVEANLQNCHDVDIAESGLFKGSATIDEIDVRGRFEGNLVVRKRLFIRATGRVSGTIRYGQIEIECGGQISGDIQAQLGEDAIAESPPRVSHSNPPLSSRRSRDPLVILSGADQWIPAFAGMTALKVSP